MAVCMPGVVPVVACSVSRLYALQEAGDLVVPRDTSKAAADHCTLVMMVPVDTFVWAGLPALQEALDLVISLITA